MVVRPFWDAHREEEHGMGDILGLGVTHYPPLIGRDENMATILRTVLRDPGLPDVPPSSLAFFAAGALVVFVVSLIALL